MKTIKLMSILAILCSIFGCKSYQSLSVDEFEKAISDRHVIRLDVRTPEEYAEGHIEGTRNIDVLKDDFKSKATSTLPKKDATGSPTTIAVNCRSGKRSKKAASILARKGYKVIELDTGYNGWVSAGKPVVK